ncbi:MAG TPA: IPT/TIG domain-containing protein [Bryobacteraceae bacterium]|nr:IPT/TIG domain-containing protein [Bryobacteraceae bacterium]
MPKKALFALLLASVAASAASGVLLGFDYSEWADWNTVQLAADAAGNLYTLSFCTNAADPASCVTKISADGRAILWRYALGYPSYHMAVDPAGDVFVVPYGLVFVDALTPSGTLAWHAVSGVAGPSSYQAEVGPITIDSAGRTYVAGYGGRGGYVVRLDASGTVDYTKTLGVDGGPWGISVDPTGANIAVALGYPSRLVTFSPGHGSQVVTNLPETIDWMSLVTEPNGDTVLYSRGTNGKWLLRWFSSSGALKLSKSIVSSSSSDAGIGVDASGTVYIAGFNSNLMHPVKDSVAPCGSAWISAYLPDGSLLQTTYVAGRNAIYAGPILLAVSPNAVVYFATMTDPDTSPSLTGPFPEGTGINDLLSRFSPTANPRVLQLACVGDAASFTIDAVSPGEIVALFGNGLGPEQGVATQASLDTPFPTEAGNVEVTFDGTPAPLLWVQDSQINVSVPWSVSGAKTKVCVKNNSVQTNCLTWPVAELHPGVFMTDDTYAAALNEDGTVNSAANPAKPGTLVSIFATGLGPISPPQADGSLVGFPLPVNSIPVAVFQRVCFSIGCEIPPTLIEPAYMGPAPYLIAGASQINLPATAGGWLYLGAKSQPGASNYFAIHVAGQ